MLTDLPRYMNKPMLEAIFKNSMAKFRFLFLTLITLVFGNDKLVSQTIGISRSSDFEFSTLISDTTEANRLINEIAEAVEDSSRTRILSALLELSRTLRLSKNQLIKKNGQIALAVCLKSFGSNYIRREEYERALLYTKSSLVLLKKLQYKKGIAQALNNLATIYSDRNDLQRGLELFFESLKISEELKDTLIMSKVLFNISGIYQEQNQFTEALQFYNRCMDLSKRNLKEDRVFTFLAMGYTLSQKGDYDEGLHYLFESMKLSKAVGNDRALTTALTNIADTYHAKKDLVNALRYHKMSLEKASELNLIMRMTNACISIAKIYSDEGKYSEALLYAKRGLLLAKKSRNFLYLNQGAETLKQIYAKQGNYKEAFRFFVEETNFRDSFYNESNSSLLIKNRLKYEYERKALSDSIKIEANKKNVELSKEKIKLELKQKTTENYFLYACIVMILIIGWLTYNRFRLLQQQKDYFIQNQKLLMEEKQKKLIKTELDFLNSQINPHFLFNALNAIYFQIDKVNTDARISLQKFSDILRYQLYDCDKPTVPIEKEIEYIRNFTDVQLLRKKANCICDIIVTEEVKNFDISPLNLIPFVENAFKYLSHKTEGYNRIKIKLSKINSVFLFEIINDKDNLESTQTNNTKGGIGIANVKRRLELIYPGRHSIDINDNETEYRVLITVKLT